MFEVRVYPVQYRVHSDRDRPRPPRLISPVPLLSCFSPLPDALRATWMRSEFSTSWIPKNSSSSPARHQPQLDQSNSHQYLLPPPSSPLLTPRPGPSSKASSFAASVRSVFQRSPQRVTSAASLRSAYSANSVKPPSYTSQADSTNLHPYAAMVAAPLPVVSSHDASDEEEECPVCLEPLSSSFRLPGEKPHIVPECGHALHEVSPIFRYRLSRLSLRLLPPHPSLSHLC